MVGGGGEVFVELGGELFRILARLRVDDGGTGGGVFEELEGEVGALGLGELDGLDGEVVAAEAGDEDSWVAEVELHGDVALDGGCGGGREGDDGSGSEGWQVLA